MFAAQKGFTGGFSAFHIAVAAGLVPLLVGFTGFIVLPLRRLGVMTIPEYYGIRYGKGVRVYGGILLALAGILNMGMFLVPVRSLLPLSLALMILFTSRWS